MSLIQNPKIKYLGVDAGGTFTDFVLKHGDDWRIHKVLSTPDNPAKAILQGIHELGLDEDLNQGNLNIVHGSTVATNAALERKGARTVYLANKGFADVLTIGRQARKALYNLTPEPPQPPVPAELCVEVDCRRDAKGEAVKALSEAEIARVRAEIVKLKPEAIAINLLFSFLDDRDERALEQALADLAFVSRSSQVLPKYMEYERGMATWLNASLGPKVQHYIEHLAEELKGARVAVMQSSGGTMALAQAATRAVNLLLSGPAGGLAAIRQLGQQTQQSKIISFDMGGTSTDVSLMDGDFLLSDQGSINDWPVAVPMLDMATIGAGGGSIAWLDGAKMLHVGPQSAGSYPGPACYGNGGEQPTVTDANLVLGRLQAGRFLGGNMQLNAELSEQAMSRLGQQAGLTSKALAEGIIRLAEQQMVQALHNISIKKGHKPSDFTLCCFGGAGGMHVCSLAEQMQMDSAIVPRNSGVLSAMGMLCAPKQRQLAHSHIQAWQGRDQALIAQQFAELEASARHSLEAELEGDEQVIVRKSYDLRYQGQSYSLNIDAQAEAEQDFITQHRKQYGHDLALPVELVNLCIELKVESQIALPKLKADNPANDAASDTTSAGEAQVYGFDEPVKVIERDSLKTGQDYFGPLIITEHVSTTWLRPGWRMQVDSFGNLVLSRCK